MKQPMVLFANTGSGSAQDNNLSELWQHTIPKRRQGGTFIVREGDNFEKILDKAILSCKYQSAILVVAGGDGTISSIVKQAAKDSITFAVLPQGTFNFFARSHKIPLDIEDALHYAINSGPVTLPLAYINEHPFLVNVGIGLYPKVIAAREYHQQVTGRSGVSAILSGIWTILREQHVSRAQLRYGDVTQKLKTPLLMISHNAKQLEQLDSRFQTVSHKLTVLRMHQASMIGQLRLLSRGLLGRLLDEEYMDCFAVDDLTVDLGRRKVRVAIDGELMKIKSPLHFHIQQEGIKCLLQKTP